MTIADDGFIISRLPSDGAAPGLLLVLADPAPGTAVGDYLDWYRDFDASRGASAGLTRIRHFDLAAEQLLPHRAANASHRHVAIYEFETTEAMLAATPQLLPGSVPGAAERVDLSGVRVAPFAEIWSTYEGNPLPEGAQPRPEHEIPAGPPGIFMAFTRPDGEENEAAYNEWYNHFHLPETLHLIDVHRGRRHQRLPQPESLVGVRQIETPYLTLYDLDNTGAVPANRELMPWLLSVAVDHLGPEAYDRAFTQAFIYSEAAGSLVESTR